jgi:hypothetical protein
MFLNIISKNVPVLFMRSTLYFSVSLLVGPVPLVGYGGWLGRISGLKILPSVFNVTLKVKGKDIPVTGRGGP